MIFLEIKKQTNSENYFEGEKPAWPGGNKNRSCFYTIPFGLRANHQLFKSENEEPSGVYSGLSGRLWLSNSAPRPVDTVCFAGTPKV